MFGTVRECRSVYRFYDLATHGAGAGAGTGAGAGAGALPLGLSGSPIRAESRSSSVLGIHFVSGFMIHTQQPWWLAALFRLEEALRVPLAVGLTLAPLLVAGPDG